jgi:hypothetical protein
MHKKKGPIWLLIASVLSLMTLAYLILSFSPSFQFPILGFTFSVLLLAMFLLFIFTFSVFSFMFNNSRRGFLLGLLVISYLLLRLNGLTSPFFAILLLILFGGIELFFIKRK